MIIRFLLPRTVAMVLLIAASIAAPIDLAAQWNPAASFPAGPSDAAAAFVIDDVAYVTGGLNSPGLYAFDKSTKSWSSVSVLPGSQPRPFAFAFAHNGKGYVGGGAFNGGVTDEFYEYDPATKEWTELSPFGGGPRDGCFAFVADGKAYVGAGFDGEFVQADVWQYNFEDDSWAPVGNYPGGPAIFPSSFVLDGKGYVVGGQGEDELNTLFEYNPENGEWTRKADFPGEPRQAGMAFVMDGMGYYGSGMADYTVTFRNWWSYDPTENAWNAVDGDYPTDASAWGVAFSFSDIAYVGTGAGFDDTSLDITDDMYSFGSEQPVPTAIFSTVELDFGDVEVGQSKKMIVGVTPLNEAGLEVKSAELIFGAGDLGYSLEASRDLPANISFGDAVTFEVTFEPGKAGEAMSALQVRTNDPANDRQGITINGVGVENAQPAAVYNVQELNFGEVEIGSGRSLYVRVTPANGAGLTIESANIATGGPEKGFHRFVQPTLPTALAPGDTLDIRVTFEPTDDGDFSSALEIETNDAAAPQASITLNGTGAEVVASVGDDAGSANALRTIAVSPHPVGNMLNVEYVLNNSGVVNIEIVDLAGRTVLREEIGHRGIGKHATGIATSELLSGPYVVRILQSESVIGVGKIVRR